MLPDHLTFRLAEVCLELSSGDVAFELNGDTSTFFVKDADVEVSPSDRIHVDFRVGRLPNLSSLIPAHTTDRLLTWFRRDDVLWLRWEHPFRRELTWVAQILGRENLGEVYFTPESLALLASLPARTSGPLPVAKGNSPTAFIPHSVLSTVCRFLMLAFLTPRFGILHHTAAAVFRGRMWLFLGPSGIGKSTLARLLAEHPEFLIVGDESAVTRHCGTTSPGSGQFRAYGTPWYSSARVAVNASAPLGGLFFLNQSAENRIEPLAPREAFHRLLPVSNVFWWHPEWMPVMLDVCDQLSQSVPAWQFSFTPASAAAKTLADFLE